MPKQSKNLSAIEVRRLTMPGRHSVGTVAGLMLNIKPSGTKSWVLRVVVGKKRKDIGLGGYPEVTLANAHELARQFKEKIRRGIDPVTERKANQMAMVWTFKACAQAYIETFKPSWKNAKHAQQWERTLDQYVYPHFGDKPVKDVDTPDITKAITPLWSIKNETMVRVRNRIELVLSWASAQGHRPKGFNPATWRGHLDQVLPKPSKVNDRKSFEALPIDEMHIFMHKLGEMQGTGARCLEFLVLTTCRSGEARGATWSEIDFEKGIWSIPASRMKGSRPHRIPLSSAAVGILKALPRYLNPEGHQIDLVFPGRSGEKPLSDMSLSACMRRMNLTAVPHGFRSTFTDWAAERTNYSSEVREMALAHAIGNQTEAAYRRGDLFDKRRELMQDWATFLSTSPSK
jgi:integrase